MILTLGQVEAVLQAVVDGNDHRDAPTILAHILHEDAAAACAADDAISTARVAFYCATSGNRDRTRKALAAAIEYHAADTGCKRRDLFSE